ncbi:hypothetical protein SAMN05216175_101449 [Neptunomonas qingdaonensis]|uniref:Uncharacterized protein n=1 Tax=Neptunomonas qingdaonensis TaxID=1045558 RepID=A0A1I2M643_9GAMM|nr:hypothetical protein SAMN05216175_101449 [Neptunomonas qingdaonensis]
MGNLTRFNRLFDDVFHLSIGDRVILVKKSDAGSRIGFFSPFQTCACSRILFPLKT